MVIGGGVCYTTPAHSSWTIHWHQGPLCGPISVIDNVLQGATVSLYSKMSSALWKVMESPDSDHDNCVILGLVQIHGESL